MPFYVFHTPTGVIPGTNEKFGGKLSFLTQVFGSFRGMRVVIVIAFVFVVSFVMDIDDNDGLKELCFCHLGGVAVFGMYMFWIIFLANFIK